MPVSVVDRGRGIKMVVIDQVAKRNALDEAMYRDLAALWPMLAADRGCRAVILTGAGDAFCSGADLSLDLASLDGVDDLVDAAFLKTGFFPKPLVAAIDGACVAGGLELALSCDIRIASERARLGLPEPRWGIFPAGGGAQKLADEIGYARASDLLLTGRIISASEALAMGLVSDVVPAPDLADCALQCAFSIASNSPAACFAIKRYLHSTRARSKDLAALERKLTLYTRGADAAAGAAAFLDKRQPQYEDYQPPAALLPERDASI